MHNVSACERGLDIGAGGGKVVWSAFHATMEAAMPSDMSMSRLPAPALLHALAGNWWLFLIKGIASIVFGLLAFLWPGLTLLTLVLFYGIFVLVDGVAALTAAIMGRVSVVPRWWLAVVGVLGIAAGILTLVWPGMTALLVLLFIAGWSVASGVFQIVGALRLRKEIDNEWTLVLGGALSVLFGVALFVMPGAGALALVWLIASFAIVFGVLTVAFALRLRGHRSAVS